MALHILVLDRFRIYIHIICIATLFNMRFPQRKENPRPLAWGERACRLTEAIVRQRATCNAESTGGHSDGSPRTCKCILKRANLIQRSARSGLSVHFK